MRSAFQSLIACILLAMTLQFAFGSETHPNFSARLWQLEDGLPHNVVQALVQTHDGYLWVGTREGLARFDGIKFSAVNLPSTVANPSITTLYEGREGRLWIGTQDSGLLCRSDKTTLYFTEADGLSASTITTIMEDKRGVLWIGTTQGFFHSRDKRTFSLMPEAKTDWIWSQCIDQKGQHWFVGTGGLKSWQDEKMTTLNWMQGLPRGAVRSVFPSLQGGLWIGTSGGIGHRQDGRSINFSQGEGPSGMVGTILEDSTGNVWVGTYDGLFRLIDAKFVDETKTGRTSGRVYCLLEDREKNIWVGSEGGLTRLVTQQFRTYDQQQGLPHSRTVSVCPGQDGSIWISTWGGGISRLKDGQFTLYNHASGLAGDFILGICESRDGSLWAGMDHGDGLDRIKDGQITHYGTNDGLTDAVITAICEDQSGNLWIGTRTALNCLRDGKFSRYTTTNGLSHNKINAIHAGSDLLWIGTDGGITLWKNEKFTSLQTFSKISVLSFYEDAESTIWIGTRGQGLKRIRGDEIQTFTVAHGLSSDTIYSILEDNQNRFWMSGSKGIFHVDKSDLQKVASGQLKSFHSVRYGKADGVISGSQYTEAVQPAACKSKDGSLWFRTTQGVAVVDPEKLRKNSVPPTVQIEEVISDKSRVLSLESKIDDIASTQDSKLKTQNLVLEPGRGELEIRYTGLSLTDSEKNNFRYKLEGFDSDWIEASTRRIAYYNNLPPGNYTFKVTAANNDGVWNSLGSSIKLSLQPHVWQTWWFKGSVIFSGIFFVGAVVRFGTRKRLQFKLERLEQQHAVAKERTRIAQDMHDDLGARLTEILVLSNLTAKNKTRPDAVETHSGKISTAAQEVIDNLHSIVWAVNPKNDSLEKLWLYIREFAQSFLESSSLRCRFEFPEAIPNLPLSSEVRHNLFLVVKEAANNIVKHAQASEVMISLCLTATTAVFHIVDNGRGFHADETSSFGNGLQNMRKRMENVGGSLELNSQPGKGTRIELKLPLHR